MNLENIPIESFVARVYGLWEKNWLLTYPDFTLCAFPRLFRPALNLLGTRSGRDGDKIAASGLTPQASTVVAAPGYEQAELALECRKMYWQDYDPAHFIDPEIASHYPMQDYHRMVFGEILVVRGVPAYRAPSAP